MSDGYVGSMYVRAMQNLVYAISNEISCKNVAKKFDVLLYLVRSARYYADNHAECMKVYDASARDVNLADTLERVVALTLTDSLDEEVILRCLEVSLKRGFRRGNWKETSLVDNPALLCGLVSVLLIAPMIRKFLVDGLDVADVMMEYDEKTTGLLKVLLKKKCSPVDLLYYLMVDVAGFSLGKVTKAKVGEFYTFCRTAKNFKVNADFSDFGFVEKVVPPFDYSASQEVQTKRLTDHKIQAECSVSGWGALALSELGEYRLSDFKSIGVATQGHGNTLGDRFAANFRVTANRDLAFLPKNKEGKSSAGKHYRRNGLGRWNYDNSSALDMTRPVVITITSSGFTVKQNGKAWFSLSTSDPVVLGFKKYEFQIEKIDPPASTSSAPAVGGGGASKEENLEEIDEDDVCAMALAKFVAKTNGKKKSGH